MDGLKGSEDRRLHGFLPRSKPEEVVAMKDRSGMSEVKTLFLLVALSGANKLPIL